METLEPLGEATRRTFLAQVIGACIAFLGTLLGIPALGAAIGPALRREETAWFSLGRPDTFQEGVPKSVDFTVQRRDGWIATTQIKTVWVLRGAGNEFTVYNGRCTHLGCAYHWQADENQFDCPCHAAVFALDGRVLAGPPPRALDTLESRLEGGVLQVQYQDFRLGTPDKVSA